MFKVYDFTIPQLGKPIGEAATLDEAKAIARAAAPKGATFYEEDDEVEGGADILAVYPGTAMSYQFAINEVK